MTCSEIQNEIANKLCFIGNHFIQNSIPISEKSLNQKEIKELCQLLKEYNKLHPVNIDKAQSVLISELRPVTGKKELNYIYKNNENKLPLYFGLSVLGQLEI